MVLKNKLTIIDDKVKKEITSPHSNSSSPPVEPQDLTIPPTPSYSIIPQTPVALPVAPPYMGALNSTLVSNVILYRMITR
jgi:hypothetical protein